MSTSHCTLAIIPTGPSGRETVAAALQRAVTHLNLPLALEKKKVLIKAHAARASQKSSAFSPLSHEFMRELFTCIGRQSAHTTITDGNDNMGWAHWYRVRQYILNKMKGQCRSASFSELQPVYSRFMSASQLSELCDITFPGLPRPFVTIDELHSEVLDPRIASLFGDTAGAVPSATCKLLDVGDVIPVTLVHPTFVSRVPFSALVHEADALVISPKIVIDSGDLHGAMAHVRYLVPAPFREKLIKCARLAGKTSHLYDDVLSGLPSVTVIVAEVSAPHTPDQTLAVIAATDPVLFDLVCARISGSPGSWGTWLDHARRRQPRTYGASKISRYTDAITQLKERAGNGN